MVSYKKIKAKVGVRLTLGCDLYTGEYGKSLLGGAPRGSAVSGLLSHLSPLTSPPSCPPLGVTHSEILKKVLTQIFI